MASRSGPAPGSTLKPSGRTRRLLLPLRLPLGSPPAGRGNGPQPPPPPPPVLGRPAQWRPPHQGRAAEQAAAAAGRLPPAATAQQGRHAARRRRPPRLTQLCVRRGQVPGVGDAVRQRRHLGPRLGRRRRRRQHHAPPLGRLGLRRLRLRVRLHVGQLLRGAGLVPLEGRVRRALVPVHHHRGALAVAGLRLLLLLPAARRGAGGGGAGLVVVQGRAVRLSCPAAAAARGAPGRGPRAAAW
jgi:hypothetical protein